MTIKLYELAGADPEHRFSPYCWRTRLALAHKGLAVETVLWRFTDAETLAFSGQGRVPVIVDGERVVHDSWAIALYLEEAYPDRPSLFGGPAAIAPTRFINAFADAAMLPAIARMIVADIFACVHEGDRDYFRRTREARFGMSLDAVCADRDSRIAAFRDTTLLPLRHILTTQPFLGGEAATYADYIVFGNFQWARLCSGFELLDPGDVIAAWRERMLDAFDGLARRAPGAPADRRVAAA